MVIAASRGRTARWVGLIALVIAPWVLANVITVVGWMKLYRPGDAGQAIHYLVSPSQLLTPPVVFLACLGTDVFLRKGLTLASPHQHWIAGGWFAAASVLAVAGSALTWGGTAGMWYEIVWTIMSGYTVVVWLVGACFWHRTFDPVPNRALWDPPVDG